MSQFQRYKKNAEKLAAQHVLACDPKENKARPEWEADCDINTIVKRIERGEPLPPMRKMQMDVMADYTVDLDGMYGAAREMAEAYNELPEAVRKELAPGDFLQRALRMAAIDPTQLQLELEAKRKEEDARKAVAEPQQPKDTPKASA